MSETVRVGVIGGGVAGLSTAWHLVELWSARSLQPDPPRLELHFVAMLAPHPGGNGSGLGGKAMSRTYTGWIDPENGLDRRHFYGPMLPWSGCVPHGYHILWEYPNLRRMLGDDGTGTALELRPVGGASHLGAFQGLLDDPSPGGPGIAIIGLCDPKHPDSARTEPGRALLRLGETPLLHPFVAVFERLFGRLVPEADPLVFADMLFTHELDVEMRLALVGATLASLRVNPETATVEVDGVRRPLTEVEYDVWAAAWVSKWARGFVERGGPDHSWLLEAFREIQRSGALVQLAEGLLETDERAAPIRDLLPEAWRPRFDDARLVYREIERLLREAPAALARLATGRYPAWRSLHFRFAPDATFASPFSYDAAQALRSLVFCYRNPRSARMWSVDGQRFQSLWLRMWQRLAAAAEATRGGVTLHVHEGRAVAIEDDGATIRWGPVEGHGGAPHSPGVVSDLGMPHAPSLVHDLGPVPEEHVVSGLDAVVATCAPGALAAILRGEGFAPARAQLAPVSHTGTETLELVIWLDERIGWSPIVREALATGAIGGLEGPFCMVADYACGLWSERTFSAERPFEDRDEPFAGSILETCGGFADLWACRTRDDAYGWPAEVKAAIAEILGRREDYVEVDARHWPHDEDTWRRRRADGTWAAGRATSSTGWEDWVVAGRWLVYGYLRQLSLVRSLGPQAVRQLAAYAELLDPRGIPREALLSPPASVRGRVRYVVMRNTKARNRFYNPGVGEWALRPISGLPLQGSSRVFPAGDWTRNGLDIVCMEAAAISAMRAARAAWTAAAGPVPPGAPAPIPVLPPQAWYGGNDPWKRGPS